MRKVFKLSNLLCVVFMILSIISCGKDLGSNNSSSNSSSSSPIINSSTNSVQNSNEYYTIEFLGSSLPNEKVLKGGVLNEPLNVDKEEHLFVGWYLDSQYQKEVEFPMIINNNTKIYGKYISYLNAFQEARANTIGNDIKSYEYDYVINATATALGQKFEGTTKGNSKYNENNSVSFYDTHENSGVLFYDGTVYQIKNNNELQTVYLNKEGSMSAFSSKQVEDSYRCDFNSFAKALFSYEDKDIKGIEKTETEGKYRLITKIGVSDVVALIGNNLNNPIIESLITELPETSIDTNMFVTFNKSQLSTYTYIITIDVSNITFNLEYILTFKNIGASNVIEVKDFGDLYLTKEAIQNKKNSIYNCLKSFIKQKSSGYDFVIKTAVDHGFSSIEINSTFKGSSFRYIDEDKTFFHNDIEIDSDYKNSDLYKSQGIDDIHIKKTKLENEEVYFIEKKMLKDKITLVNDYVDNDYDIYNFYNSYLNFEDITFIQEKTKEDKSIYSIGTSKNDIINVLKWLNVNLDLDPLDNASVDVDIFGDFVEDSVCINDVIFEITVQNDKFLSMRIKCKGSYKTSLVNSRDFEEAKDAVFSFDIRIETNKNSDSFIPYVTVEDAK